jgi:hypothetical protein
VVLRFTLASGRRHEIVSYLSGAQAELQARIVKREPYSPKAELQVVR